MGGIFLVRNDAWAYRIYERFIGFSGRKADPTHINMITPRRLKRQLIDIGLEVFRDIFSVLKIYTTKTFAF